ncbi:MAG TPA: hypothetical protein VKS25_14505 [Solirubrobacteraceae bacterium]|nr:hypothetical protein [Solirubrobacteraceae bacterium]
MATLHTAGPLAVARDGALYVTDGVGEGVEPGGDRVLVRLPNGRFRVVAGSGRIGFSGDGGLAVRAELSSVTDLAFAANGTLYVADGGRVRTVSRNGVIRTIAGDGRPSQRIANGTPALAAPLGSGLPALNIALSPSGHLFIATGSQILRLTAAGRLEVVRAVITSGRDRGLRLGGGPIAVDAQGNIDVAGGPSGWGIWQVAPNGIAHLTSAAMYAHGNGGAPPILERTPGDAVYAAAGSLGIFRVEPDKLVASAAYNELLSRPLHDEPFTPYYIAVGPNGWLYTDDQTGGYTLKPQYASLARQQLLSIANDRITVLWHGINRAEIAPAH